MMARTTVTIRDDLYNILRKEAGKRGISEKLNEILAEYFFGEEISQNSVRDDASYGLERPKRSHGETVTARYLIDSFAWMEYFMGSERGRKVKKS
jgi:hypothetical protein